MGYDRGQARSRLGDDNHPALTRYLDAVAAMPGAEPVESEHVVGYRRPPASVDARIDAIKDAIGAPIADLGGEGWRSPDHASRCCNADAGRNRRAPG